MKKIAFISALFLASSALAYADTNNILFVNSSANTVTVNYQFCSYDAINMNNVCKNDSSAVIAPGKTFTSQNNEAEFLKVTTAIAKNAAGQIVSTYPISKPANYNLPTYYLAQGVGLVFNDYGTTYLTVAGLDI